MEADIFLKHFSSKPDTAMEDVTDIKRRIIYAEIWHCLSVSFGAVFAVVIFMLLVTLCIFAIKLSWVILISFTSQSVRNDKVNYSGNYLNLETNEPRRVPVVRQESFGQNEQQPCFLDTALLPSSVADKLSCTTCTSKVIVYYENNNSGMQDYSYSSNNLPVGFPEDNDCSHIENFNWEENTLALANKESNINAKNISLSRKCKPQQETQTCNDKCEIRECNGIDQLSEFSKYGNTKTSSCQTVELICTNTEVQLSPTEEKETVSENLEFAQESTDSTDKQIALDDEIAQLQLDSSFEFDSDDDSDFDVTDSDVTIPKAPYYNYHSYNLEEQYWKEKQEFPLEQNLDFHKRCSEMKGYDNIFNDLDISTQSVSKGKIENVSKESNTYNINQVFDTSFGHQVQSVNSVTNHKYRENLESSSLHHLSKNDEINVSFCFESQRNVQNSFSSFRFKPLKAENIEESFIQSVDFEEESFIQSVDFEEISYYQKLHDRRSVETSIFNYKEEMENVCEQKCNTFSHDSSIMPSICKPNDDYLSQDLMLDNFEMESYITIEKEDRNEFETASLLPLSLDFKVARIPGENISIDINFDLFGKKKLSKKDENFTAELGKCRNSDKRRKVKTGNIQRERYGILMGHCRRFFRRMNRYRWKRCFRDVMSSRYLNIYELNRRNRNMNEGTVFPYYNNLNHEQTQHSDIGSREQGSYTATETQETESHSILPSGSLGSYFQRVSEQQSMSTEEKMQFEWMRLQSFATFPSHSGVSPLLLAKWGYFGTGNGDEAMTFCCKQKYRNWQTGDDPQSIHRRQSPSCSFILGIDSSNIPVHDVHGQTQQRNNLRTSLQESSTQSRSNQIPNRISPVSQSTASHSDITGGEESTAGSASGARNPARPVTSTPSNAVVSTPVQSHQLDQHAVRANQSPANFEGTNSAGAALTIPQNRNNGSHGGSTNRESAGRSSNETLGIFFDKPRYPNYAVLAVRISSFTGWPSVLSQTPREMSLAGFFYAGYGDYVRCFFCGGGLRNWESGDDPWVEHARWFPKCAFVRQNRGDAFVDLVLRRHAELEQQGNQTREQPQYTVDHTPQNSSADDMSTPAARSIIEMGFSEDTVRAAFVKFKKGKPQGRTINASELLEFILNEQHFEEESVNSSRRQARASIVSQQTPEQSHNATQNVNQQGKNSSSSQQQTPAAAPKTKEQKSKSDKKKKKKEKADEKQLPEEEEKSSQASTEDKKEEALQQTSYQSSAVGIEANSESFSLFRAPESLDQMTLEDVRSLREENAQLREQTICKICMDKNVSMAFLPCGHLACCEDCAPAMRTCPICRQLVKGTVKTFLV